MAEFSPPSQYLQSTWAEGQSSIILNGLSRDVIKPHLISMLAYAIKYDNFILRWRIFILFLYKRLGWGSNSWHSLTTMGTLFPHCSFQRHFWKPEIVPFRKETAVSGTILNVFSFDAMPGGTKGIGCIPSNLMKQNSNPNSGVLYTALWMWSKCVRSA